METIEMNPPTTEDRTMLTKKAYLAKKAAMQKAIIAKYGSYTPETYRLYRYALALKEGMA